MVDWNFKGESKKNRMKALKDCASNLLNPIVDKLGLVTIEEQK